MRTLEQLLAELDAAGAASPAYSGQIATVRLKVTKANDARLDADATVAASTPANRAAAFNAWDSTLLAWERFLLGLAPSTQVNPSTHIAESDLAAAKKRSDETRSIAQKLLGYQFGDDPFGDLEAAKKASYLKLLDAQQHQAEAQAAFDRQMTTASAFADYVGGLV